MIKPLTRKQEAFVAELVANPSESATEAAQKVYNAANRNTARSIATENLSKPAIQSRLAEYTTVVEDTLYRAVTDWGDSDQPRKREIALDSAKYIHDKVNGKATQKVETQTAVVLIGIDMTKPAQDTTIHDDSQ